MTCGTKCSACKASKVRMQLEKSERGYSASGCPRVLDMVMVKAEVVQEMEIQAVERVEEKEVEMETGDAEVGVVVVTEVVEMVAVEVAETAAVEDADPVEAGVVEATETGLAVEEAEAAEVELVVTGETLPEVSGLAVVALAVAMRDSAAHAIKVI